MTAMKGGPRGLSEQQFLPVTQGQAARKSWRSPSLSGEAATAPGSLAFRNAIGKENQSIKKSSLVISGLKHLHFLQSGWLGERQEGEFKVAGIDWLHSPKEGPLPALPITFYSLVKRKVDPHPHAQSCFPLPVNYDVIILGSAFLKAAW